MGSDQAGVDQADRPSGGGITRILIGGGQAAAPGQSQDLAIATSEGPQHVGCPIDRCLGTGQRQRPVRHPLSQLHVHARQLNRVT
jgi:hypothetical protein